MSRRSDGGFSLLEVQVGLLLLTLVVVGFVNLVKAQESLVGDMETWCRGDPVLYVVQPSDPYERVAGVPAALLEEKPAAAPAPLEEAWAYELEVREVTRGLRPQRARAVVRVKRAR